MRTGDLPTLTPLTSTDQRLPSVDTGSHSCKPRCRHLRVGNGATWGQTRRGKRRRARPGPKDREPERPPARPAWQRSSRQVCARQDGLAQGTQNPPAEEGRASPGPLPVPLLSWLHTHRPLPSKVTCAHPSVLIFTQQRLRVSEKGQGFSFVSAPL